MKFRVLMDNIGPSEFLTEWGFSVYFEKDEKHYLLDAGSGEKFILNAQKMNIDLGTVVHAILSHAHYDHSSGFEGFFSINQKAKLYVSGNAFPNCYIRFGFAKKYIGIPKNLLEKFDNRITYVGDLIEIEPGVYVMRHQYKDYWKIAKRNHMWVKGKIGYRVDDFSHEQNLIVKTNKGLVILNSCSHIGPGKILNEVKNAFPHENIYMYIGGFHLAYASKKEVLDIAKEIEEYHVDWIYTGHCTGDKSFQILKEYFGDKIIQTYVGLEINIE